MNRLPRSSLFSVAAIAALLTVGLLASIAEGGLMWNSRTVPLRSPLAEHTLFARLLKPFTAEAEARRQQIAGADPAYARRIDPALASGRVNFLLFGYGETFEPPFDKAIIGSYTIISFDRVTGEATLISLTHDVRAPEVERALAARGARVHAVKIDQAYDVGGFDLMRRTVEDAVGLPIDFEVSLRDTAIQDMVDTLFGTIPVSVAADFESAPFYLDGRLYGSARFARGLRQMDGAQVVQYMKSLESGPVQEQPRNARKDEVLRALLAALSANCSDHRFWLGVSTWLVKEKLRGAVTYDFDPVGLLANNLEDQGGGLPDLFRSTTCAAAAPRITRSLYIVDPQSGGGGVRWVESDATVNSIARRDVETGVYEAGGLGIAVPLNGNPYGDLVDDYWGSVRLLVRQTLTAPPQAASP